MPGKVIIQSYNPENFAIQCSKKQDYGMFYETEIALRKQLKYPPFCDIILISFRSLYEKEIKMASEDMYQYLIKNMDNEQYKIFKPMPSPIDKIQNRYRWRIIIKGKMRWASKPNIEPSTKRRIRKKLEKHKHLYRCEPK